MPAYSTVHAIHPFSDIGVISSQWQRMPSVDLIKLFFCFMGAWTAGMKWSCRYGGLSLTECLLTAASLGWDPGVGGIGNQEGIDQ